MRVKSKDLTVLSLIALQWGDKYDPICILDLAHSLRYILTFRQLIIPKYFNWENIVKIIAYVIQIHFSEIKIPNRHLKLKKTEIMDDKYSVREGALNFLF